MRAFSSRSSSRSAATTRSKGTRQPPRALTVCASANDTIKSPPTPWSAWYGAFVAADSPQAAAATTHPKQEDSLTTALELLQQAVDTEQYEAAAKLRDASLAWLGSSSTSPGGSGCWYRPVSNPQARAINSSSSLLYVSHSDPSRWTGLLFTPADFMHFDLAGNCNSSELEMAAMLEQSGRYGTPLFEVWVLPEHPHHHQQQQQQQQQQSDGDPVLDAEASSSTPSSSTPSSSSRSFVPVVVGLQSVNRAFNELLGVRPNRNSRSRSQQHPGPQEPRYLNQRLLLVVQPDGITAAAVHGSNDATLWTWHISPPSTATAVDAGDNNSSKTGAQQQPSQQEQDKQSAAVAGPFRPAERSGGVRPGLTIDGHSIDHLRGPGSLTRTGADSFSFCRQSLPADVLCALACTSNIGDSGWRGSSARLFRVDLQYQLPPAETGEPAAAAAAAAGEPAARDGTEAAAAAAGEAASNSDAGGGPDWDRVAAELCSLLAPPQVAGSSSSSGVLQRDLSALLAAAAVGTAPEGGAVSEAQQAVTVTEVVLEGGTAAAAAPGDGGSVEGAAAVPAAAVEFVRVSEPTASLSFGGWQVTASLT